MNKEETIISTGLWNTGERSRNAEKANLITIISDNWEIKKLLAKTLMDIDECLKKPFTIFFQ